MSICIWIDLYAASFFSQSFLMCYELGGACKPAAGTFLVRIVTEFMNMPLLGMIRQRMDLYVSYIASQMLQI